MTPITSLWDFFETVKIDKRYERLAIIALQRCGWGFGDNSTYEMAKNWINDWIRENQGSTCDRMTAYLNDQIKRVPNWDSETPEAPTPIGEVAPATPPPLEQTVDQAVHQAAEEHLIMAA